MPSRSGVVFDALPKNADRTKDRRSDGLRSEDERPEGDGEKVLCPRELELPRGEPALGPDRERDRGPPDDGRPLRTAVAFGPPDRGDESSAERRGGARVEAEAHVAFGAIERVGPVVDAVDDGRIGAAALAGGLFGDPSPAV